MARAKTVPGPISISLYIFLGAITLIAAVMFGMAELRAVQNRVNILPLRQNYVPVSCQALSENEGRLVHIDCPLHKLYTFHPPADFAWNLRPFRGVFLEMKVEMFQWILLSKSLGFYFGGEWSPNLVDSSNYPFVFYNSHINPDFFPNINGAGRSFAPEIYGGDFRLGRKHLTEFHSKKQLSLVDDHYYTPPAEHPPASVSYANTQLFENALYTGNPRNPKIGDLRITFWGSTATHVSAIAQQKYNSRDGVTELVQFTDAPEAGNHTVTELVYEGDFSPKEMFSRYLTKRDGTATVIWSIRGAFLLLLTALVTFTYRILDTATRVALFPLILGATSVSAGIIFFICAPLWLLCDTWHSALFGAIGVALMILGLAVRTCGAQYTAGLLDDVELGTRPPGGNSAVLLRREGTGAPKHYYQPV